MHKSAGADDKKLQTSLKKLNVQPIQAIEEVNMFKSDGNVIHFAAPKGNLQRPPPTKNTSADSHILQFTLQSQPTPSLFTATARTRNSPSSSQASSTNSVPTPSPRSESWPRAISPCRRRRAARTRRTTTTTKSQTWSRARTSRIKSSRVPATNGAGHRVQDRNIFRGSGQRALLGGMGA